MASPALSEPTWEVLYAITILGEPIPKGSMKGFPIRRGSGKMGVVLTNANPRTRGFEEAIAQEAFLARGHNTMIEEPVFLAMKFFLPRPKSAPRWVIVPAVARNDADKLQRTLFDGLKKGGIYRDDGQVVAGTFEKLFAGGWGDPMGASGIPRVWIELRRLCS